MIVGEKGICGASKMARPQILGLSRVERIYKWQKWKNARLCLFTEKADLQERTESNEKGKGQPRQLNWPYQFWLTSRGPSYPRLIYSDSSNLIVDSRESYYRWGPESSLEPTQLSDLLGGRKIGLSTKGGAIHEAQDSLTEIIPLKIGYFMLTEIHPLLGRWSIGPFEHMESILKVWLCKCK